MKNISKIISIVFLSFSILLLCYVFYRSQIFHSGTIFSSFYQKYYIVAFLFIILSFISFFIPKNLKINITVVFISFLIGLYLVEGYIFIQNLDRNNFVIYKSNTGKDYDKRNELEVYQDLKKEDPGVVLSIIPLHFFAETSSNYKGDSKLDYLPLSGISNRKTVHCNENGYYSIYQSDRYGFNTPDKEWDKDEIEFFLVGDSWTHGNCVNEPDTISGNLRKLIDNKNGVLNLGIMSNGPLIQYATLREYLPITKVKRVLWINYVDNDLENLVTELENQILVHYLKDKNFSQNLILREQEMQELKLKKLEKHLDFAEVYYSPLSTVKQFVKLYLIRHIIFYNTAPSASIKEFKNILKLSNELTKQNNSKLYFVNISGYTKDIDKSDHDNVSKLRTFIKGNRTYYKEIIEIAENLNIPIIDINKELFKKHEDPLSLFPFRKRNHYNEKGYQLIAETIFRKINELEK